MTVSSFLRWSLRLSLTVGFSSQVLALVEHRSEHNSKLFQALSEKNNVVLRPEIVKSDSFSLQSHFDRETEIKVDKKTGEVRLITGHLAPLNAVAGSLTSQDLEQVARQWVDAHANLVKVSNADLSVISDSTLITDSVQFLTFAVSRHSLIIQDAVLSFRFRQGELAQVMNRSYGEALDDARTGFTDGSQVIHDLDASAQISDRKDLYRVRATAHGYQLVKVQSGLASLSEVSLTIQTDAVTGEVFAADDVHHYLDGRAHGSVFARTYYDSKAIDTGLKDFSVSVGNNIVNTLGDGKFSSSDAETPESKSVIGVRMDVKPISGKAVARTATKTNDQWDLSLDVTEEKDLAQIHTFHHLNLVVARAKKYVKNQWFDKVLTANVNLSQTCNAYWNGRTVNFFSAGNNCGNTGLISDVMYHEWGHGLHHNAGGIIDRAYSEGFGDAVSMVMTRDSKLGPGFRSNGGVVRDLSVVKIYPDDKGEEHAEGLIIGGAFWDLYQNLKAKYNDDKANDLMADIAFKTIYTCKAYTDVYDAALLVNAGSNNGNKAPDLCEINAAFAKHGLAEESEDCGVEVL